MFPLGSVSRRISGLPFVTILVILAASGVFYLELERGDPFILRWSVIPAEVTAGIRPETLITSAFLHGGWMHIIGNMIFLWGVGPLVEERIGAGIVPLWLAGGAAAALAQAGWGLPEGAVMVGASGAVSAVMGYGLLRAPAARTRVFYALVLFVTARTGLFDAPLWFFLPLWAFEQGVMALMSRAGDWVQTAYGAHVGGFVFGGGLGLLGRILGSKEDAS